MVALFQPSSQSRKVHAPFKHRIHGVGGWPDSNRHGFSNHAGDRPYLSGQPQRTAKETALIRTVRLSFAFLLFVLGAVLSLLVVGPMMLAVLLARDSAAAFSILFRFHVTNFYVFLGWHNFTLSVSGF